jgi:hypothetical protein
LKAEKRLQVADELREDLNKWRQGALHFLDAESFLHHDLLTPSIRRQSIALRSIYLQTVIILHRPFLLESFKGNDSEKEDAELRDQRAKTEGLAQECVNAAFGITEIIDKLYEQEPLFSGFWVSRAPFFLSNLLIRSVRPLCGLLRRRCFLYRCYSQTRFAIDELV